MRTKTFLQLLALSALWGASFPLIRVASPLLGASVIAMLRIAFGALTLALIMRAAGQRWPWQHWRELILLALLAVAGPFFLFSWAALELPAGYLAVFNPMAVVFGALASVWLKEDTLSASKLLGCLLAFAGIGLIVQLGPLQPTPRVLLACALVGGFNPLRRRSTL